MERKEWLKDNEEKTYMKKLMDDLQETQDDIEKVMNCIDWLKNVIRPNVEEDYRIGGGKIKKPMVRYGKTNNILLKDDNYGTK